MQKTRLQLRAEEILNDAEAKELKADNEKAKLIQERISFHSGIFSNAFNSVLDMLTEADVSWKVQVNDANYPDLYGYYILFTCSKNGQELKMDWSEGEDKTGIWRYEYTYVGGSEGHCHGRKTYGKWDMDQFIVWIYSELVSKPPQKTGVGSIGIDIRKIAQNTPANIIANELYSKDYFDLDSEQKNEVVLELQRREERNIKLNSSVEDDPEPDYDNPEQYCYTVPVKLHLTSSMYYEDSKIYNSLAEILNLTVNDNDYGLEIDHTSDVDINYEGKNLWNGGEQE